MFNVFLISLYVIKKICIMKPKIGQNTDHCIVVTEMDITVANT
jgi:hypothetical protein